MLYRTVWTGIGCLLLLLNNIPRAMAEEGVALVSSPIDLRIYHQWRGASPTLPPLTDWSSPNPEQVGLSIPITGPYQVSFQWGDELQLKTTLWMRHPEQRSASLLQRLTHALRLGGSTSEDRLADSAVQTEVARQGGRGRIALSLAAVGQSFEGQAPLAPGGRQALGEVSYQPWSGIDLHSRYLRQTQPDRFGLERVRQEWSTGARFTLAPGHRMSWEATHLAQDEGTAWERTEDSTTLSLEQEWSPSLKVQGTQVTHTSQQGGQVADETVRQGSATFRPGEDLHVTASSEHRRSSTKPGEARTGVEIGWQTTPQLALTARYQGRQQGDRNRLQREMQWRFRPHQQLALTAGYSEEEQGGETTLRRQVSLEAQPGRLRWQSTWASEEQRGAQRLTQTVGVEWQPDRDLALKARFENTRPQLDQNDTTRLLQAELHPTGSLTLQGEWKERERPGRHEASQRVGGKLQWGGALQMEASLTAETRDQQRAETAAGRVQLQPLRILTLGGSYSQREQGQSRQESQEMKLDVRPGLGWSLEGRLTRQQMEGGRENTVASGGLHLRPLSAVELQGRYQRQEVGSLGLTGENTAIGLTVGGERHRLFSEAQMERSLQVTERYLTRYRLGYQRKVGGLALSMEGSMERSAWGRLGWAERPEYRGEMKIRLSF